MKKLVSLENLIYLIVFSLPLYLIREQVLFLRTNVLENLIMGAFIWWLIVFFKYAKIENFYFEYRRYLVCGALIVTGFFWAAFSNGQALQSLSIIKSWLIFPLILLFVAADVLPQERLKNIFLVYAASTFLVAVISIGYLLLGHLTYDGRLMAFFNSPNYLAMYLAPGVLMSLWARTFLKWKMKMALVFLAVLLVALFFTYSYAAFGAVFLSSLVVLWMAKMRIPSGSSRHLFLKEILAAGLIFILFFAAQAGNDKFSNIWELRSRSSLASRAMIWQASSRMVKDNLITGIGAANFQKTYLAYQKFFPPYLEWAVPHPQNIYLAIWLFGGLLGAVGFLGLLFFFFRDLLKNKSQNSLEILALGIMLYILLHGLFDTTYFKNDLAIVFWLNFLVLKKATGELES
ncbi:MAG: O-antigen ligase family protein [Parcubacteria group bacterium]